MQSKTKIWASSLYDYTSNQACERTGSSAGEFRCFFLIRALHLHPERGSREPVAPLDRWPQEDA
jgi:hypothetical protein